MKTLKALVLAALVAMAPEIAQATPFPANDSLYGHVCKINSPDPLNPIPISNAKVTILNENNSVIDSTFSDSTGYYHFTNLTGVESQKEVKPENNLDVKVSNPSANPLIKYVLPKQEKVEIKVYNMAEQKVATLDDKIESAGNHSLRWNASGVANGSYIINFNLGNTQENVKTTVLKGYDGNNSNTTTAIATKSEEKPTLIPTTYGPWKLRVERTDSTSSATFATQDSLTFTGSNQFNAGLLPPTYRIPSGATVTVDANQIDSLWGISPGIYNPTQWWQWPVPTFLSNCSHQDSLDVINAIGPLDTTQTPADSSVDGKLKMKYIYGVTDSATHWNNGVLLVIHPGSNTTQIYNDDPGHPGYLGRVVAGPNFSGYNVDQHEAAGWGMGKWLQNAFSSNMNSGSIPEYTAKDDGYTILIENNKILWQTGKQQIRVYYFGK